MDARLQEMLDHHEIRKTLSEYCQGADRVDRSQMESVYASESWDDHGSIKAPGPEYAEKMSAQIRAGTVTMYHCLGQSIINVDGDTAGAETYFFAVSQEKVDSEALTTNQLGGRFVDRFRRENGRWLIENRTVVREWSLTFPSQQGWESTLALTDAERSSADVMYAVLGRTHSGT